MNEDDIIKDDALEDELPEDIKDIKKSGDILDEETENVDDLADEEEEEEPFDDVNPI